MKAVRKRLRDDFRFYAPRVLKIRTKKGKIEPFHLNWAQEQLQQVIDDQLDTTGMVRVVILKARQLGLSTHVGGRLYQKTSQNHAQKTIVMTHKTDSTKALFDMTKRFHAHCPEAVKPSTKYSSKKELDFDLLDSQYMVATAGGDGVGRGETITLAHLSELAFWPEATARENFNGLLQAIPNEPGTEVYIESTANGVTGPFYETWQKAVSGENGYYPLFIPWFVDPSYRRAVPEGFEKTPEEEELADKFSLDDGQLMFRRIKVAENGREMFMQEYPATPEEAFISTGRPVFNSEQLVKMLDQAPDFIARMSLTNVYVPRSYHDNHKIVEAPTEWKDDPRGELLVYLPHNPGETYTIGADVAMGIKNGDFSVAQVLDSKKRQAAVWRGHIHPDFFGFVLYHLGTHFNTAKIAVESNNHGLLTVSTLYKELGYGNVYCDVVEDKVEDKDTVNLGFRTTTRTKPLIIDDLRASLREREIELYDKTTLREMLTFVVKESGKMEAEDGCFDDTVMGLAICNHVHDGILVPIQNQTSWYIEAV